jgi:hypothetical protein
MSRQEINVIGKAYRFHPGRSLQVALLLAAPLVALTILLMVNLLR